MAVNEPASDAQVKAIYAIAASQGLHPDVLPVTAGKQLTDLTRGEASALIDRLKAGAANPSVAPAPSVGPRPSQLQDSRLRARIAALTVAGELAVASTAQPADVELLRTKLFSLAARCEQWLYRE